MAINAEIFSVDIGDPDPEGNVGIEVTDIGDKVLRGHLLNRDRLELIIALEAASPERGAQLLSDRLQAFHGGSQS